MSSQRLDFGTFSPVVSVRYSKLKVAVYCSTYYNVVLASCHFKECLNLYYAFFSEKYKKAISTMSCIIELIKLTACCQCNQMAIVS